jgi:anaerobic selenocysteine-containing dehydrogenase
VTTTTVHGACPHDCPDTCAMLVTVVDGRAVKVAGDPEHPVTNGALCAKVNDYVERVYAADRVLHPLIRTGPKGEGRFREATWDEALDAVATGLLDARDRFGGESIVPYSYLGTQGFVNRDLMSARVMHALGASEIVRNICADAGVVGVVATHGLSPEVDPERWPNARYVVAWGWNPLSNAPHLWRFVMEARKRGARLVVIDPVRSRTARVADEHVRPVPGTDAALALGMMRAMVDAGVHADAWCREHATGYDDLLSRLDEWPVDRAAAVTGVDAETIRRIGVEFATTQPSLLRLGVGGQRHAGAPIAYRTIACVPALAGSWRHDGGGCAYIPVACVASVDWGDLQRADLRPHPVRSINMAQIGDALTDPGLDPPLKALVVWCSNPAQIAPDQAKVHAGLARDDLFTVVIEQFVTDTARFADVVLPATTQLEHRDLVFSWGHHYLTMNEAAIAPLGEAKPNSEIFRLLAARLGLDDPAFSESDDELLESVVARAPETITLAGLSERGWAKIDLGQGPVPHAEGGFGTADGKVAFRADWLAGLGLDPLPTFDPPAEVVDAELAARYPLALLTPKTHFFLNSTFSNQARQHKAQPEPFVVLHPDDAAAREVADGDLVRLFNDRGECRLTARVSDDAPAGVAVAPMGWWSRDYETGLGAQALTSQRVTVFGDAPTFNDTRVEVARVALAPSPAEPSR